MGKIDISDKLIHAVYNTNTFVKVKAVFNIGKVLFAFVEKNNAGNVVKSVDCFLEVSEAALLGKKITSFRMYHGIKAEKEKGEPYPKDVWKSPLGGVDEATARERNLRKDGKAISRMFSIAPGAPAYGKYAVITARAQAAVTDTESGLIIPVSDESPTVIRIAVENHDALEELGIMLEAVAPAYITYLLSNR